MEEWVTGDGGGQGERRTEKHKPELGCWGSREQRRGEGENREKEKSESLREGEAKKGADTGEVCSPGDRRRQLRVLSAKRRI